MDAHDEAAPHDGQLSEPHLVKSTGIEPSPVAKIPTPMQSLHPVAEVMQRHPVAALSPLAQKSELPSTLESQQAAMPSPPPPAQSSQIPPSQAMQRRRDVNLVAVSADGGHAPQAFRM